MVRFLMAFKVNFSTLNVIIKHAYQIPNDKTISSYLLAHAYQDLGQGHKWLGHKNQGQGH